MSLAIQIEQLDGDDAVLCVVVVTPKKIVIVANSRYPHAITHAEAHLAAGFEDVQICSPNCAGTQR